MNISNIDVRVKFVLAMSLSSLSVLFTNVMLQFLLAMFITSVALFLHVDLISVIKKLKSFFKIIVAIAILQSIFTFKGTPIIHIAEFNILTDYGLLTSMQFILRMTNIVICAAILSTSSSREFVQGLIQCKVPYEIAFMTSVGIRFLPILREEFVDAFTAIQLRGIDIKRTPFRKKMRIYLYLLLPQAARSILRARELSIAMEARAFRAYPTRTSYRILKLKTFEVILIVFIIAITILIIAFYIIFFPNL